MTAGVHQRDQQAQPGAFVHGGIVSLLLNRGSGGGSSKRCVGQGNGQTTKKGAPCCAPRIWFHLAAEVCQLAILRVLWCH